MKIRLVTVILAAFLTFQNVPVHASPDMQEERAVLKMISEFADEFCQTAPIESSRQTLDARGKIELSKFLGKLVDVEVDAYVNLMETTGVLQKDLATVIANSNDCRMAIWPTLKVYIRASDVVSDSRRETLNNALELERESVVRRIIGGLEYMSELSVSGYLTDTIPSVVDGVTCNELQVMLREASILSRGSVIQSIASYVRRPFPEDCFRGIAGLVSELSVAETLRVLQNSSPRY